MQAAPVLVKDVGFREQTEDDVMTGSKQFFVPMLLGMLALVASYVVFLTAIKGDNTLRIVLASVGFLGFAGLMTALLAAKIKAGRSAQP
jgi:hypothetical protein